MNTISGISELSSWLFCQLGAREHYAIAAALHKAGALGAMYTDVWLPDTGTRNRILGWLFPRLRERYDESLSDAHVTDFHASLLAFEARARFGERAKSWKMILKRNEWFQDQVLTSFAKSLPESSGVRPPVVFAYSYAARRIFNFAKSRGWTTVLGQIDPGPREEDLVAKAVAQSQEMGPKFERAPAEYWAKWQEECELADRIVVNSEWSRGLLLQAGIPMDKLAVVPLMYESRGRGASSARKTYPDRFDLNRPLRVLFLGSLIIRKGVAEALAAARILRNHPVEFWFVGPEGVSMPDDLCSGGRVHWIGAVRRGQAAQFYDASDVFLFPTLSDGFGLTQLEAMSRGLPVITSGRCGAVVVDGITGQVLPTLDGSSISQAILSCLQDPTKLANWSANCVCRAEEFSSRHVVKEWLDIPRGLVGSSAGPV